MSASELPALGSDLPPLPKALPAAEEPERRSIQEHPRRVMIEQPGSPWLSGSVLREIQRYHGAGQPNPVVLEPPPHVPQRVPGVGTLVPIPRPAQMTDAVLLTGGVIPESHRVWRGPKDLVVMVSLDRSEHGTLLHLSTSRPRHDPEWGIISALRSWAFGELVDVAMILPRRSDWVNLSEHCFHLWQMPVEWGIR